MSAAFGLGHSNHHVAIERFAPYLLVQFGVVWKEAAARQCLRAAGLDSITTYVLPVEEITV